MSLNKFMHPRNRYRKEKPCFIKLALKYPDFRAHITQDDTGKAILDFKDAEALRALTTCLMKEDFDLAVELPANRLVPTLPLRLNYIHWIEDIIGTDNTIWGIDIGTGSSCVYPLLSAKMNQWHFLATEADQENAFYAQKNIKTNNLDDLIKVKPVTTEDVLSAPLEDLPAGTPTKFDFCMCNPPFFADHMEAQAVTTSRSVDRPEPNSMSTASPEECIATGGEVGFVRQMIEESTVLRDRIRVYTSMVGKKASLAKLKEELRHQKVTKFSTTEFCQGKTMRWGIAWTYDSTVTFPRSEFETRKEKPPLQYVVPRGAAGVDYEVHAFAALIKVILADIKVHVFQGKKAKSYTSLTLTAPENTWSNQRRRRRQQKQQEKLLLERVTLATSTDTVTVTVKESATSKEEESIKQMVKNVEESKSDSSDKIETEVLDTSSGQKRSSDHLDSSETGVNKKCKFESNTNSFPRSGVRPMMVPRSVAASNTGVGKDLKTSSKTNLSNNEKSNEESKPFVKEDSTQDIDMSPKEFILKCVLRLKKNKENVNLELEWLEGDNRELMHQLFTFIKNKLGSGSAQQK